VPRPTIPAPQPPQQPQQTELDRKVAHLVEMGFDGAWARRELIANGGDEEDAVLRMVG
jgi:uncharacterized UBP type Zn finger protein